MSNNEDLAHKINDAASKFYYHVREPYSEADEVRIFSSYHCAEKPDLAKMDGEEQDIHRKRHYAKKGIDLITGEKVDPRHDADKEIIKSRINAAQDVVSAVMTDEHVDELAQHIYHQVQGRDDKEVFILRNSVMKEGQVSYNFLSPTYDYMLIEALQEKLDHIDEDHGITFEMATALRLNDTRRVYSDPIQRLARQAYMDTDDLEQMRGKNVLIADEHVQSGAMVTTIYSLLKKMGGDTNVMGVTTLTSHPTMTTLSPNEDVNLMLRDNLQGSDYEDLEGTLNRLGLGFDTLTAREGLYILALVMDGHDPAQKSEFLKLEETLSGGRKVVEGVEDDLHAALLNPPLDVQAFDDGISDLLRDRRGTFYRTLDLDDIDGVILPEDEDTIEAEGLGHDG